MIIENEHERKELLKFPIIHGRSICNEVIVNFDIPKVSISDNLHVVTVVDQSGLNSQTLNKINLISGKINYIFKKNKKLL